MVFFRYFREHGSKLDDHSRIYFQAHCGYGGMIDMNMVDSVPKGAAEDIDIPRWVGGVHFQRSTGGGDGRGQRKGGATARWTRTWRPRFKVTGARQCLRNWRYLNEIFTTHRIWSREKVVLGNHPPLCLEGDINQYRVISFASNCVG